MSMNTPNSTNTHWRTVLEEQQLANAERWLTLLAQEDDPADMVIREYDNLLRALEIALQKPDFFDLAYRLIEQLFVIVFGYADWDRWLIYLNEAIGMSQVLGRAYEEANLLSLAGNIFVYKSDFEEAVGFYQRCIQKYQALDDEANHALTLTKLANVYILQGDTVASLKLLHEAQQVSNSSNDLLTLSLVNLALSNVYHKSRDWESGLVAAQTAYALAKELGKGQTETQALLNIIACQNELGNWGEVERLSTQLEGVLQASGDLVKLGQLKNNLGIAAFSQQRYYAAEKAWQDALQINTQINFPIELAGLYNNLGMVYTKLGEFEAAESMLQQAVTIYYRNGDLYNWANTLDNMADVYEIQGMTSVYGDVLELAISKLEVNELDPNMRKLLYSLQKRLASLH